MRILKDEELALAFGGRDNSAAGPGSGGGSSGSGGTQVAQLGGIAGGVWKGLGMPGKPLNRDEEAYLRGLRAGQNGSVGSQGGHAADGSNDGSPNGGAGYGGGRGGGAGESGWGGPR